MTVHTIIIALGIGMFACAVLFAFLIWQAREDPDELSEDDLAKLRQDYSRARREHRGQGIAYARLRDATHAQLRRELRQ